MGSMKHKVGNKHNGMSEMQENNNNMNSNINKSKGVNVNIKTKNTTL